MTTKNYHWYPGSMCTHQCKCGKTHSVLTPCDICDVPCPKVCTCKDKYVCECGAPCELPCPQICKIEEKCKCQEEPVIPCNICDTPCPPVCTCGKEICICAPPCTVPCPQICKMTLKTPRNVDDYPCNICTAPCPEKCICLDPTVHICSCQPGKCTCEKSKVCDCSKCVCSREIDCTCEICLCQRPIVPNPIFGNSPYSIRRIGNRPLNKIEFERYKSKSQGKADDYLKQHYIFELFHYLLSHILVNLPDNPVAFLIDLLNRMLMYRDKNGPAPLLFEDRHIQACYRAMDPQNYGSISVNQYILGLTTLGIQYFNREPFLNKKGLVPKETFLTEANKRLLFVLDDLIERKLKKKKTIGDKTNRNEMPEMPL